MAWAYKESREPPWDHAGNCYLVPLWMAEPAWTFYAVASAQGLRLLSGVDIDRRGRLRAHQVAHTIAWGSVGQWSRDRDAEHPESLSLNLRAKRDSIVLTVSPDSTAGHPLVVLPGTADEWERVLRERVGPPHDDVA
ncbi:MAG: hypothetical protein ACRDUY_13740 [Nitriliruptorales bacterium]